jgi:hypothetical protein
MNADIENPSTVLVEEFNSSPKPYAERESGGKYKFPPTYTPEIELQILRKMDIRLLPMLAILYFLAFLDRGNIGNAKIEGLLDDFYMSGQQYSWCCMPCVIRRA